ncbi:hypothetical protein CERZMDRAFT_47354 [Cercospora zeae-maydis SCOH1-5]|uniref:A to I editase domain-containing protein n=1 Tax=Cercospora zeae-maydis SCOH1-5 TaxID=717836 RepID=A0A6A6F7F6_9PEZI|nr:hypothetical protein CERZMDRAFT_47354 [Cercospora zeae-maydis SCOH1-5]
MTKADVIAECILRTFEALPAKCKPRTLPNGRQEWVPLAGIVLTKGPVTSATVECAALATGMKCLPQSKLGMANGNVLHDWHAEILALRSFNRFLLDDCAQLASKGREGHGSWVCWRPESSYEEQSQLFQLQDGVEIHMYCSEAPCGDASMELTMAEQTDATPWERQQDGLLGRGNFDQLGVVRRKPSRPDAPRTLSKSCSDKLALKQCTGLLSGLTTLLVHPGNTYLATLILPEEQVISSAVQRSFSATGRLSSLEGERFRKSWSRFGYRFQPFEIHKTTKVFDFCKPSKNCQAFPSNISVMYTPQRQEILINGVLQGRKQADPKGASCVSRRRMWESVNETIGSMRASDAAAILDIHEYAKLKQHPLLEGRELVKRDVRSTCLPGWMQNVGDDFTRQDSP